MPENLFSVPDPNNIWFYFRFEAAPEAALGVFGELNADFWSCYAIGIEGDTVGYPPKK